MDKLLSIILMLLSVGAAFGQGFPEDAMKKRLKADVIEMDHVNEDGVIRVRHKETGKWGMYQWMFEGTNNNELIPMEYDSVAYIPFNGNFSFVFNDGKVGVYLAKWSYDADAKQTVPCQYEEMQRRRADGTIYLAAQKDGKWGWIDWLTGEEKTEFIYDKVEDLPWPDYTQESWF